MDEKSEASEMVCTGLQSYDMFTSGAFLRALFEDINDRPDVEGIRYKI